MEINSSRYFSWRRICTSESRLVEGKDLLVDGSLQCVFMEEW